MFHEKSYQSISLLRMDLGQSVYEIDSLVLQGLRKGDKVSAEEVSAMTIPLLRRGASITQRCQWWLFRKGCHRVSKGLGYGPFCRFMFLSVHCAETRTIEMTRSVRPSTQQIDVLDAAMATLKTAGGLGLVLQIRLGRDLWFDRIALGSGLKAAKERGLSNPQAMRAMRLYDCWRTGQVPLTCASVRAAEVIAGIRDCETGEYMAFYSDTPFADSDGKMGMGVASWAARFRGEGGAA